MAKTKRSLTFTDETWELMQKEADRMGVSVSALISMTMSQYIKGQQAIIEMGELRRMLEQGVPGENEN